MAVSALVVHTGDRWSASLVCSALAERRAMIKKVKGGYKVLSEKGKNLGGPYKTKQGAE